MKERNIVKHIVRIVLSAGLVLAAPLASSARDGNAPGTFGGQHAGIDGHPGFGGRPSGHPGFVGHPGSGAHSRFDDHSGFHERGHPRGFVFVGPDYAFVGPDYYQWPAYPYVDAAPGYWYYCPYADAYYPYVVNCPEPWIQVPPD